MMMMKSIDAFFRKILNLYFNICRKHCKGKIPPRVSTISDRSTFKFVGEIASPSLGFVPRLVRLAKLKTTHSYFSPPHERTGKNDLFKPMAIFTIHLTSTFWLPIVAKCKIIHFCLWSRCNIGHSHIFRGKSFSPSWCGDGVEIVSFDWPPFLRNSSARTATDVDDDDGGNAPLYCCRSRSRFWCSTTAGSATLNSWSFNWLFSALSMQFSRRSAASFRCSPSVSVTISLFQRSLSCSAVASSCFSSCSRTWLVLRRHAFQGTAEKKNGIILAGWVSTSSTMCEFSCFFFYLD